MDEDQISRCQKLSKDLIAGDTSVISRCNPEDLLMLHYVCFKTTHGYTCKYVPSTVLNPNFCRNLVKLRKNMVSHQLSERKHDHHSSPLSAVVWTPQLQQTLLPYLDLVIAKVLEFRQSRCPDRSTNAPRGSRSRAPSSSSALPSPVSSSAASTPASSTPSSSSPSPSLSALSALSASSSAPSTAVPNLSNLSALSSLSSLQHLNLPSLSSTSSSQPLLLNWSNSPFLPPCLLSMLPSTLPNASLPALQAGGNTAAAAAASAVAAAVAAASAASAANQNSQENVQEQEEEDPEHERRSKKAKLDHHSELEQTSNTAATEASGQETALKE